MSSDSTNLGTESCARSTNSRTASEAANVSKSCFEPAGGNDSERTVTTRSPGTPSASRLVTSTCTRAAALITCRAKAAHAAAKCSQLSRMSSVR